MPYYFPKLLGYLASALIAMSMMMSSVLWLRVINMVGATAFTTYGLLIHAYPVAALNGLIVVVNGSYVFRTLTTGEYFQVLKLEPQLGYLKIFPRILWRGYQDSGAGVRLSTAREPFAGM